MKANNFMVGDWVLNDEGTPYRVAQVNDCCYDGNSSDLMLENGDTYTDIKPIPLTAEILVKNGWKNEFDKKPYMTFYHLEDERYWLLWCISEHTLDIQRQNKTLLDQYNLCAERVVIACEYVHQLQHALRLCGIDKEIVL